MKSLFKLNIILISLFFLIPHSSAIAKKKESQRVWVMAPSPFSFRGDYNINKKNEDKIWLHRPSKILVIDRSDVYMENLTKKNRLENFCLELKSHFIKIEMQKVTENFCLFSGTAIGKTMVASAVLDGSNKIRHLNVDLDANLKVPKENRIISTFISDLSVLLQELSTL
jgi:hypothetical protein